MDNHKFRVHVCTVLLICAHASPAAAIESTDVNSYDDAYDWSREAHCKATYVEALSAVHISSAAIRVRYTQHVHRLMEDLHYKLHVGNRSGHGIVLGVGAGTTATRGLAGALYTIGLDTGHWLYHHLGHQANAWKTDLLGNWKHAHGDDCSAFSTHDFRFPVPIDALTDTPVSEFFWVCMPQLDRCAPRVPRVRLARPT